MEDKLVNILLVEDDSVDVMNVQRAFKKNNIQNPLYLAKNGLEGLAMLRGTDGQEMIRPRPQIILKDLRSDPELKSISVFVMTTSKDDKDRFEAYNLNVAGYIIKPVSFEKFVEAVSILDSYWKLCEQP